MKELEAQLKADMDEQEEKRLNKFEIPMAVWEALVAYQQLFWGYQAKTGMMGLYIAVENNVPGQGYYSLVKVWETRYPEMVRLMHAKILVQRMNKDHALRLEISFEREMLRWVMQRSEANG